VITSVMPFTAAMCRTVRPSCKAPHTRIIIHYVKLFAAGDGCKGDHQTRAATLQQQQAHIIFGIDVRTRFNEHRSHSLVVLGEKCLVQSRSSLLHGKPDSELDESRQRRRTGELRDTISPCSSR
jgi:hypothetical protein